MKRMMILLLPFLLLGCKKDNPSSVNLSITPGYLIFSANSGSLIKFRVNASADRGIKKVYVTSDASFAPPVLLVDTTLDGQKLFSMDYEYEVPGYTSAYTTTVSFEVIDREGNTRKEARRIDVKIANPPLTEHAGITLYSKRSQKPDAYNIIDLAPLFSDIAPASVRDIQVSSDYDTSFTLSRSWISPSGAKFVSYAGFDYVNATRLSIENAYNSGVKLDKVALNENDIVLTRISRSDSVIYAAIKVNYIIDQDSSKNDRFVLDLKK